jgi:hypothetical protein
MDKLPEYAQLRYDQMSRSWVLTCAACGIKERYWKYWTASRVAYAHAEMHEAE